MISPYQVEYTMTIGNRIVGECLTVYASSEFFAIDKVRQELHRRFGSATSIELHASSSVDRVPERVTMGI
ncbi:DUF3903 domain-containing protein [Bacillus sp. OTU530]|uniref:DUF3903 domain-containing protein n=1 Tax=Bacillus sp. OTU530 TaxID=3043862 RepID=UPI00313F1922